MLRFVTAGESHGAGLIATLEGIPAHVQITTADVADALARRRLGAGRGARMKFERDEVQLVAGVRHGETLGSPIAILIKNSEWEKWQTVMDPDPVAAEVLAAQSRGAALTRPRPGHADLAGMQKYDWDDARPLLERASARETAARVAIGRVAQQFLAQAVGTHVYSHVVELGPVSTPAGANVPAYADLATIDADPVRCFDPTTSALMQAEIADCHKAGDTLGGVVEVLANIPIGLGSHAAWDRRLDAKLAAALMGIQAIKGVEVGDGFALARERGSAVHDEIELDANGQISRATNRAGGVEGGMSNGATLRVRAAMKPIATVPHALRTIDTATGQPAVAHHQRSDVCAVPAAGVVAEAMVALVLAEAVLEKFGGDSLRETQRNYQAYLARLDERGLR